MRWSEQSIEQAIQTAKSKNAIFVVYVQDDTRPEHVFHSLIEGSDATDLLLNEQFVAIRIQSSSQSYRDFASIYQLVPVPSIFFIGQNGWPLEIITGDLSQSEVIQRIRNLLGQNAETPLLSEPPADKNVSEDNSTSTSSSSTNVCAPSPSILTTASTSTSTSTSTTTLGALSSNVCAPSPSILTTASTSTTTLGALSTNEDDLLQRNTNKNQSVSEKSSEFSNVSVPSNVTCDSSNIVVPDVTHNMSSSEANNNSNSVMSKKEETEKVLPKEHSDSSKEIENLDSKPPVVHITTHNRVHPQHEMGHLGQDVQERVRAVPERSDQSQQRVPSYPQTMGRGTRISQPSASPGLLSSVGGWMQSIFSGGRPATTIRRSLNENRPDTEGPLRKSSNPLARDLASDDGGDQGFAHIQFRLPNGSTHSQRFFVQSTIREVREYVQNNIALPFRDFILSTSYPRVEFTEEHLDLTIATLGLVPRSVILIIPGAETAQPAYSSVISALWALVVWPFTAVYTAVTYLNFWISGGRDRAVRNGSASQQQPRAEQQASQRERTSEGTSSGARRRVPTSSTVQREGNIHRLTNRQDDSDDENNTWNGNSTQQM